MLKALIKVRLRGLFASLIGNVTKKKKHSPAAVVGITLLIAFLGLVLLFSLFVMAASAAMMLVPSGRDWIYFGIFAVLAFFLSIFGSFMHAKNMLFDSKDNDILIPMPIPPLYILVSRVASLFLSAFFFIAIILFPAGIVYCFFGRVSFLSVVGFILSVLALSALSTAVSSLFGFLIAFLSRFFRNKSLFTVIATLAFLAVYFVVYGYLMQIDVTEDPTELEAMLVALEGALANTPIALVGRAFLGAPIPLLLLVLPSAALFLLMLYLLSRGFLSVTREAGSAARRRAYRADGERAGTPRFALFKKDLSLLFHNGTYIVNAALGPIALLIAGVFLLFAGGELYQELSVFTGLIESESGGGLPLASAFEMIAVPLCTLAVTVLSGAMTTVTAPSISVEAKTLWQLQSLPVRPVDALLSKVYVQLAVTLPPLLFATAVATVVLRIPFYVGILLFVFGAVFSFLAALFGLVMNLLLPKFNAISLAHAVKQSGSVAITMFAMMPVSILFSIVVFVLTMLVGSVLSLLCATVVAAGISALFVLYLYRGGSRRFARLSPSES